MKLKPPICLITGANSGIGKQAATQLAHAGARVILACRDEGRGAKALEEVRAAAESNRVELMQVDMSLMRSVRAFADELRAKHDRVDVLINNAAYFDVGAKARAKTDEGIERTWATNHLGPVLLTRLLSPALKSSASGRVVIASSKGLVVYPRLKVDVEDPEFERRPFSLQRAYYQSKLAQVAFMLDLARELEDTSVKVHGVRITAVKLDIGRYPHLSRFQRMLYAVKRRFSISADEMARTYTWLATSKTAGETTGKYWDAPDRPAPASKAALDQEHRAAIATVTKRYLEPYL